MPTQDEEDLEPLPPLDGDDRDEAEPDLDAAELPDEGPGGGDGLDDSTGEADSPDTAELAVDEKEPAWLGEPTDAPDLDLGDMDALDFREGAEPVGTGRDGDEPPPPAEDDELGVNGAGEHGGLDGGDEGPLGDDEELREEDLPGLDADDEGELDDAALVDAGFAADEPLGLPWAAEPWSRVGAPVALAAAAAVACSGPGALAAGRGEAGGPELVRVDLEGTSQAVPAEGLDAGRVRGLAVEEGAIVALRDDGRLFASGDSGVRFLPIQTELGVVELASSPGAVWARTRDGLVALRPDGRITRFVELAGVVASARDGSPEATSGVPSLAALVVDDGGRSLVLVHVGVDGSVRRDPVDGAAPRLPALLAVRGPHAAYAAGRGVVRRTPTGTWRAHEWDGQVTAMTFVDDTGALVAATYAAGDDTTALVRLDARGLASVVARIGPGGAGGDSDGRVAALAYDDARGVVWVAGGFGVAAFAVR